MKIDISRLTLREKIGQTMCMLCEYDKHIARFGSIEKMLEKYPIGALHTCKGMDNGKMLAITEEEYRDCVKEYNKYLKIPILKMGDAAPNNDDIIEFVSSMAIGAAADPQLAYRLGVNNAKKNKAHGLDFLLSPVVDVNISPQSPIINTRAYGDNSEIITAMANAYIKGLQENGVGACAKHYPGPDDKECVDPHIAPTDNNISKEVWDATNGKVYKGVIAGGVWAVMTGHQNLLAYQKEKIDGRYPGATMSYDLVTKLLKGKLGFRGVVVTDALCMGGFTGVDGIKNQVRSLTAGNDLLLWPELEYMDEVERLVLSGEIPMERIDDAVTRVLELKEKVGTFDEEKTVTYDVNEIKNIRNEIANRAATLVRNECGVLPAKNAKKVLTVVVTPSEKAYKDLVRLGGYFAEYGIESDVVRDVSQSEIEEIQKDYDLVLFALQRGTHDPIGPMEFWGDNAMSIWASNTADTSKTVVVSFGSPYHFTSYYKNTKMTYINAYSRDDETLRAVVRGILGKQEFLGKSPVKL